MELPEVLESLTLDLQVGKFLLNGIPLENVDHFVLEFKAGVWNLNIRQHRSYCASGKATSTDAAFVNAK